MGARHNKLERKNLVHMMTTFRNPDVAMILFQRSKIKVTDVWAPTVL